MILPHIGTVPGLTSGDEISLVTTVVLGFTLVGVYWYAKEARSQALATTEIARATMRPVLTLWALEDVIGQPINPYRLFYQKIGSGPALNFKREREPPIGEWDRPAERVSMSIRENEPGWITLKMEEIPTKLIMRAKYQDVAECWWQTDIVLERINGKLQNRDSVIKRLGKSG